MTDTGPEPAPDVSYHAYDEGQLKKGGAHPGPADPVALLVHSQFRAMMLSEAYTCIGGASAVRRGTYRFGVFPELATPAAVEQSRAALGEFLHEFPEEENAVAVFVASFEGPVIDSEASFEQLLWQQLQGLHDLDTQPVWWDPTGLEEWNDELGFVFGGRNFFVVGLHPAASRWSRRFGWPTLVFNALSHVRPLERADQFARMQSKIRARDHRLQGSNNPSLDQSQVAQFSGRDVEADWEFPLRPRGHETGCPRSRP
ncbi:guanitoxin biosynthesis heme-dependent pre-guanitoxin N-hydroxylase GntA [Streptomyces sp. NBC_01298]|uniref:guanitoxin biosynthesis heme-dependent pre-guanitoxin N-hydroxylase GntA n=1 Tax=Streptomyces sp. NBC_01298 TaxID=2903817 RepID=UPI002E10F084|nr:guanitoxin biosynthesis heme-dependent pre-guanitoxin N-hydroxylase GntA [Streptomyces sp. NBC_01298]